MSSPYSSDKNLRTEKNRIGTAFNSRAIIPCGGEQYIHTHAINLNKNNTPWAFAFYFCFERWVYVNACFHRNPRLKKILFMIDLSCSYVTRAMKIVRESLLCIPVSRVRKFLLFFRDFIVSVVVYCALTCIINRENNFIIVNINRLRLPLIRKLLCGLVCL